MAYPTVSGPYGLIPTNLIGGQVFAGSTRQIAITNNSGTAIFYGDVVKLNSVGTIEKDVGTTSSTAIGVFLGCTYTDATYGKVFKQYYPASTIATDTMAYVSDDPDALYKVAVVQALTNATTATAISYCTQAALGTNLVLANDGTYNAGSTTTGDSKVGVCSTVGTTTTWPVRVVDFIKETAIAGYPASYTEVVVKFNFGVHRYYNATGNS